MIERERVETLDLEAGRDSGATRTWGILLAGLLEREAETEAEPVSRRRSCQSGVFRVHPDLSWAPQ